MNNWTRIDRVLAFVRLARRPVGLVEIAEALGDYEPSVSTTLSMLFATEELNRTREPDEQGRLRYHYTDPAYDELIAARHALHAIRRIAEQGDVNVQPLLVPILDLVKVVLP
jgi:hypothetical protein